MPNAGIHPWRSISWNSAEPGLNDAHIASVTPKTAIERISVTHLMRPLRCPSALPTNNSSAAPMTGSSHETLRSTSTPDSQSPTPKRHRSQTPWGLGVGRWKLSSSPQVVAQNQHDADEKRARIRAHRSRLQAPQQRRAAVDDGRGAVDGTVDHVHVDALPQPLGRDDANRLDDRRVVHLVDVVLVEQQLVEAGE